MKVKELIELLANCPPEAEIRVSQHHYFGVWDTGINESDFVVHPDCVLLDTGVDDCRGPGAG